MEGFTKFKKMQCFKEGGSVQKEIANYEKRERKVEEKQDETQDKKVVKKAFSIHDKQQHEEKTDLSKLRKGGRAKKDKGTVKKYCGGKSVKKMADGGMTDPNDIGGGVLNAIGKVPVISEVKSIVCPSSDISPLELGKVHVLAASRLFEVIVPVKLASAVPT